MNKSFFVQWLNNEHMREVPVLANDCHSFEQAAAWAVTWDLPTWADDQTEFMVWRGFPGEGADYARFMVGNIKRG